MRRAAITFHLLLLALAAGSAVMILELCAPRLCAPHVGTSSFTWTVVIATFLLGIALGNVIGGRLADGGRRHTLPLLLLVSGLAVATTPWLLEITASSSRGWSHAPRVLCLVPLTFLPPAIVLGTVPPAIARALLGLGEQAGWRLGAVSAAGAIGSVGGTILAGFVLVPAHGLRAIVLGIAGALVVFAAFAPRSPAAPRPADGDAKDDPSRRTARSSIALAFVAGAALLWLEILAGRMASTALGASLFTWTSVIGVVLAGLAVGAGLGGVLADRFAPRRLLGWLFLITSAAVLLVLWAPFVLEAANSLTSKRDWPWSWSTLAVTTAAFLVPSVAIGTLSPVVIRAALADPRTDGRTVGVLYAWGTLGATAAAVALGAFLVPMLGLERLALLLAFVLAAVSGFIRGRQPYLWMIVLVVAGLAGHAPWRPAAEVGYALRIRARLAFVHREDSRYSRVLVRNTTKRWVQLEEEPDTNSIDSMPLGPDNSWEWLDTNCLEWDGPMSIPQMARLRLAVGNEADQRAVERLRVLTRHQHRVLSLDRLVHGYVDLQDSTWLGYGYERLYAAVIRHHWPEHDAVRCLFIGGGAYSFQRRLLAKEGPGLICVTAEIDPRVTQAAVDWLGLVPDPRHLIAHGDARTYVEDLPPGEARFDFVLGDAFNDLAVPFHLTTREFNEALAARMTHDGVYLVNVIDSIESGRFLGAFIETLRGTFRHVGLLSVAPRINRARDTFVVVASNAPLRLDDLPTSVPERVSAILYAPSEIDALRARARHLVLTDDHAPVETLLAPVVSRRRP